MKIVSKKDLTYKAGYLVDKEGNVVTLPKKIECQLNRLEELAQKSVYLQAQAPASPLPTLEGFKRKSIFDREEKHFICNTPALDKKVAKTVELMHDIDKANATEKLNYIIEEEFEELCQWVKSDDIVNLEFQTCNPIDMPMIGNPLELTEDDIENIVASFMDVDVVNDEAEDVDDEQVEE